MDREGVDLGVVGEDRAGAVAVVQVEVDDQGARRPAVVAQRGDRHGDVVVEAEPRGAVPARAGEGKAEQPKAKAPAAKVAPIVVAAGALAGKIVDLDGRTGVSGAKVTLK